MRSGRPATYAQDFRVATLAKLEEEPPAGYAQWDGPLLAAQTGYSKQAIWRFLRSQRICLARKRSWCVSTDPLFAAKAADVVGLYLAPPENALVICVDEKPNIQALERATGHAVSSDRKLVRALESTYKRNGTLNLFAALEVATGQILGKTIDPAKKTKKGFLEFMDELLLELPESGEYHVVMDNHSIHKRHERWLDEHPMYFSLYINQCKLAEHGGDTVWHTDAYVFAWRKFFKHAGTWRTDKGVPESIQPNSPAFCLEKTRTQRGAVDKLC